MMMEPEKMEMEPEAMMEGGQSEFSGGEMEGMMMEGMGDGMMMAAMMEASVTDPRTASTDTETYEGFANVPGCFLRNALKNPFFGDLVKAHVINWEFFQAKAKHDTWGGVAGLLTSGLASSARTEADAWFSGYVGELDQESFLGMEKGAILFPGWIEGWANAEDATNYVKTLEANL